MSENQVNQVVLNALAKTEAASIERLSRTGIDGWGLFYHVLEVPYWLLAQLANQM